MTTPTNVTAGNIQSLIVQLQRLIDVQQNGYVDPLTGNQVTLTAAQQTQVSNLIATIKTNIQTVASQL